MIRAAVLWAALLFAVILLALTVHAAVAGGIDVLTLLSALVLALLAIGVVGALRHPPDQ